MTEGQSDSPMTSRRYGNMNIAGCFSDDNTLHLLAPLHEDMNFLCQQGETRELLREKHGEECLGKEQPESAWCSAISCPCPLDNLRIEVT